MKNLFYLFLGLITVSMAKAETYKTDSNLALHNLSSNSGSCFVGKTPQGKECRYYNLPVPNTPQAGPTPARKMSLLVANEPRIEIVGNYSPQTSVINIGLSVPPEYTHSTNKYTFAINGSVKTVTLSRIFVQTHDTNNNEYHLIVEDGGRKVECFAKTSKPRIIGGGGCGGG